MFTSPRRFGPALRLALARRPWIRWLAIIGVSVLAGWLVLGQLRSLDAAREAWTDQATVFVAAHDHAPGDPVTVEERRLPIAAVPASAVDASPDGELARQNISVGEIVTIADLAGDTGPAGAADDGEVVVPIADPLLTGAMSTLSVGLNVAVHSEGVVLAERARIVAIDADIVFVALDPGDATGVSAAAQLRLASLAFLR